MKPSHQVLPRLVVSVLLAGFIQVPAATFTLTSDTTITASDLTYDGADLIVDGCMVTMEGSHGYASLLLRGGSVLRLVGHSIVDMGCDD